jgi:hypothetical protein
MKALITALIAAKRNFKPISKDKTASLGKYNYKYVSLNEIIEAAAEALAAQGIVVIHRCEHHPELGLCVATQLIHESGEESYPSYFPVKQNEDPKQTGALITYGRRYNLCQLLDIAVEEDIDASPPAKLTPTPAIGLISEAQRKRLRAIQSENKISDADLREIVAKVQNLPLEEASTKTLTHAQYKLVEEMLIELGEPSEKTN